MFLEQVLLPGPAKMEESLGESKDPWSEIIRALPELLQALTPRKLNKSNGEVTAHA